MNIFPTSYGREDGKVTALKVDGGWVLRSIRGPAWFWNHQTQRWDVSCVTGFRVETPSYVLPEEKALGLLPTLEPML